MAVFYVRPELNGGKDDDWTRLHDAMFAKHFYRVLKVDEVWYDLPTGFYRKSTSSTKQQVFHEVVAILKSIGKKNLVGKRDYELIVLASGGTEFSLVRNTDMSKRPSGG